MPAFSFEDPPSHSTISVSTTATQNIVNDGVSFTWSVAGDGFNKLAHTAGGGFLTATMGTFVTDVFALAVNNGPTQNKFLGNATTAITLSFQTITGTWQVKFSGATPFTTAVNTGVTKITGVTGEFSKITFTSGSVFNTLVISGMNTALSCFLGDTLIAVPGGETRVEDLRPGDRILTADGRETTVRWLGTQPVDTRLTHPAKVNPIRITAGALGGGLPARDLCVSQDHAIVLDGHLINAGALVNGTTIRQVRDMPLDGFTYWHVETTGGHELLLAEGVAAETFIDYAGRDSFVNGDERDGAPAIPEMDLPRISSARLVPEAIRARLAPPQDLQTAA